MSEVVVECRRGNLAAARGTPPGASLVGQLDMAVWKRIVGDVVREGRDVSLRLVFFGAANQITGYRLYYMLRYAKRAGVRRLTLHTDGVFWNDEATEWLVDSGVDQITLACDRGAASGAGRFPELSAELSARVHGLDIRAAGTGRRPVVELRPFEKGNGSSAQLPAATVVIDWRGDIVKERSPSYGV
jgi:hypothetical protein